MEDLFAPYLNEILDMYLSTYLSYLSYLSIMWNSC